MSPDTSLTWAPVRLLSGSSADFLIDRSFSSAAGVAGSVGSAIELLGLVTANAARFRSGLRRAAQDRATARCRRGGLTANLEVQGHAGPALAEAAVHPNIAQSLAALRVKGWQREAEQARLAHRARLMPYAARLALLRSRHVLAARPRRTTRSVTPEVIRSELRKRQAASPRVSVRSCENL